MARPPLSTKLGKHQNLPTKPDVRILDPIPNPHPGTPYLIRFTCPEFTCLCPITGQPDFAHFVIDYCPHQSIVESKSLKLYLHSYRNHGSFHEDTSVTIGHHLVKILSPKWFRLAGFWYPRGGIPIDVFFQTGSLPRGVYVPELGVSPYRGRG